MNQYISDAWAFVEEAKTQFVKGKTENNAILMRDACEKAWGAVVQAMSALFIGKDVSPLPKSHRDRRIKLRELEAADPILGEKNFFDRFMARDHILHERAFYDGDVIPEEIEAEFPKVEQFIRDVEEISQ